MHWLICSPRVPISLVGLASATDLEIWAYARQHGLTVVSKDDDFRSLSLVNGVPLKVIWLRIGNASTAGIEAFIRSALVKIRTFAPHVPHRPRSHEDPATYRRAGAEPCAREDPWTHDYLEEKREALGKWAAHLQGLKA